MASSAPGKRRRNGRAAFKAVELEVRAALAAGRTLVAIFEEKQERLGMSYAQFARYTQPLRAALSNSAAMPFEIHTSSARAAREAVSTATAALEAPPAPAARPQPGPASGPSKGRPEDAVRKSNMDGFAKRVLERKDLI